MSRPYWAVKQIVRRDRPDRCVEDICRHGIGHPNKQWLTKQNNTYAGVHGCDGCCLRAKKPDWAQRMVDNARLGIPTYMAVRTNYQDVPAECEPQAMVLVADLEKQKTRAAALLRAHHRKVKRMVQKLNQDSAHLYINCDEISAYRLACEHIMDKLKELEQ